jgi:hypothetical protein
MAEFDNTKSAHETCTAHSGLNIKTNIQTFLSGVAVALLIIVLNILINVKSELTLNAYIVQTISIEVSGLKERITILERLANENKSYNLDKSKDKN